MLCDICSKHQATVHLTEIVDEQMTELHLCERCAKEKSVQMEQQFGLADLLAGLTDIGKQIEGVSKIKTQCTNCGLTYEDFRKSGRLGCSECYSVFKQYLSSLLKKIHGSSQHTGKAPAQLTKSIRAKSDLQDLKIKLSLAIQKEEFEEAANLRDQIRELEKKENKSDAAK
ncbi:UvrB/UvrC motif-containing protein [Candidatus Omnitrophota bacterium]